MPRLTKSYVERQTNADSKPRIIRDSELPGFGIRINQATKSWVVEKRIEGVNRRITVGNYPAMSAEEARRQARKILSDISKGIDPIAQREQQRLANLTLAEVLNEFLACRKLLPYTAQKYRNLIERNLSDWLEMPIREITREMVEERFQALVGPTRCRTEGKSRANNTFQVFGGIVRWASERYRIQGKPLLDSNPVDWLTQSRRWFPPVARQGTIPDNKLSQFYLGVMSQPKIARDFILLILFSGLRKKEAAKLRWQDIDLEAQTMTIPAGFNKSKRDHILPLSDIMLAILRSRQGGESEYVFPGRIAGHINEPRAPLANLRAEMGWHWLIHDLRRTCLSSGEKVGVPFLALQKIANHSVRREVTERYLVLDTEYLRPHMQAISSRLLQQMGTSVEQWQMQDSGMPALVKPASARPVEVKIERVAPPKAYVEAAPLKIPAEQIVSMTIIEPEYEEEEVYF